MACGRSISTKVTYLMRKRFFNPSFSCILHDDDGKSQPAVANSSRPTPSYFLQRDTAACFGAFRQERSCSSFDLTPGLGSSFCRNMSSAINAASSDKTDYLSDVANSSRPTTSYFLQRSTAACFGALRQERRCSSFNLSPGLGIGSSLCRHMSSAINVASSDKTGYLSDVAIVLTEKGAEGAVTQVPVVNEVAIAAADSFYPVAALQYFIDAIHSVTGLNWWASIALTTVLIRGVTFGLLINQLKATSKLTGMDPKAVAKGRNPMQEPSKEYGVTQFTQFFITVSDHACFYCAIMNMVEKVPSFKYGGALWFTDLTTPDSLYIFPVLIALTILIRMEYNLEAGAKKYNVWILAVLMVPFTMSFPTAMLCHWLTFYLNTFMCDLVQLESSSWTRDMYSTINPM